jgi:hypothetical protein
MKKKYVGRTFARNNFFAIINEVKDGQIYYVSDRDDLEVAIVPIKLLNKEKEIFSTPISESDIFRTFTPKTEMQDSVEWVRKQRSARKGRIYG